MSAVDARPYRKGAAIGGWVCLLLGSLILASSGWLFLLYLPLFLVSFVLGIVAMAQRHLAQGIVLILLSILIPTLGMSVKGISALDRSITASRPPSSTSDASPVEAIETPELPAPPAQVTPAISTAPVTPTISEEDIYIADHLELYDFSSSYREAVLDGRVPGVDFKIKNKGNRTLQRVEVTVYFEDKDGNTIAEENYFPVLKASYGLSPYKPLKPGYIWQSERGKFYSAKSVPSEWKEGKAHAEITSIEFEKTD